MKIIKRNTQKSINIVATFIVVSILLILTNSVSAIDFGGIAKKVAKDVVDEVDKSNENPKQQDTTALVKRAKTELRAAERKMFGGKKEEAAEQLQAVKGLLEEIEKAEPEQKDLKYLNSKYVKIKKDLDKRMGKSSAATVKSKTTPATQKRVSSRKTTSSRASSREVSEKTPAASSGTASAKLPYHAKQKMKEFDNLYRSVGYSFEKMEAAKSGKTTTSPEKHAETIKEIIPKLQSILDEAKSEADKKGVSDHPDLKDCQAKIDAIPAELKKVSGEVKAVQKEKSAESAGIAADIETLNKEFNRLRDKIFNKATGTAIYYNDLKPVKELLIKIEDYDKNDRKNAEKILTDFSAKYGSTQDEVTKKTDDSTAGWNFENFKKGIENVDKTKTAMAEDLVNKAGQKIGSLGNMHDFYRTKQHAVIKEWVVTAEKFDSENAKVKQTKDSLNQELDVDLKKLLKKIKEQKWTDNDPDAPSNAKQLAKTALEWFKNSPDWGKREQQGKEPYEILDVVVTGPWSVQKRNILGEPIMYGLPVKLAIQLDSEKEKGFARVFILTLRTFEGREAKMEPPFEYPTVGNSYYIMKKEVK